MMTETEGTLRDCIMMFIVFLVMAEIEGTMRDLFMIFDVCCISSDDRDRGDYEGPYHDIQCLLYF